MTVVYSSKPKASFLVLLQILTHFRSQSIPAGSGVGEVDPDVVLEPDYLGERVAAVRDADEGHRLPQSDRLALDVALDFRRARGIWNMSLWIKKKFLSQVFTCGEATQVNELS